MHAIMAPDYGTGDSRSSASVDVDALEQELLTRTIELTRDLPKGVRAPSTVQLAKDITRTGRPTIARWLRLALGGIRAGQNAALYGELVADVLGAVAATVLPVTEASLAECLAESRANPVQMLADRPDATPDRVLAAAQAMRDEAQRAKDAELAYRRRWREMVRARSGL